MNAYGLNVSPLRVFELPMSFLDLYSDISLVFLAFFNALGGKFPYLCFIERFITGNHERHRCLIYALFLELDIYSLRYWCNVMFVTHG